jgi:hypothetical protein
MAPAPIAAASRPRIILIVVDLPAPVGAEEAGDPAGPDDEGGFVTATV